MATPLVFGRKGQIHFADENEFFEALGFLSKNDGTTSYHWEHNEDQGAWGSEGRIHCYQNISSFPAYFSSAFTAGRGRVIHRINCNDYIKYIVDKHAIVFGPIQNPAAIRATVPARFRADFDRGVLL